VTVVKKLIGDNEVITHPDLTGLPVAVTGVTPVLCCRLPAEGTRYTAPVDTEFESGITGNSCSARYRIVLDADF
jgi:hypothetical protein